MYSGAYFFLNMVFWLYKMALGGVDIVVNEFRYVTQSEGFAPIWARVGIALEVLVAIAVGLMMVYFFMKLSDLYIQGSVTKEKVFSYLFSFAIAAVIMSACQDLPQNLLEVGYGIGELATDGATTEVKSDEDALREKFSTVIAEDIHLSNCWNDKGELGTGKMSASGGRKYGTLDQLMVLLQAIAFAVKMLLPTLIILVVNVFSLGNFIAAGVEAIILAMFSPIAIADIYGHGGTLTDSNGFRYMKRLIAATLTSTIIYLIITFCINMMFAQGMSGFGIVAMLSIGFAEFAMCGVAKEVSRTIMGT